MRMWGCSSWGEWSSFSHFSMSSVCSTLTGGSDMITNITPWCTAPFYSYASHGQKIKAFFLPTKPSPPPPFFFSFFFFPQTFHCQLKIADFFSFRWLGNAVFQGVGGEANLAGWGRGRTTKHLFFPLPSPSRGGSRGAVEVGRRKELNSKENWKGW